MELIIGSLMCFYTINFGCHKKEHKSFGTNGKRQSAQDQPTLPKIKRIFQRYLAFLISSIGRKHLSLEEIQRSETTVFLNNFKPLFCKHGKINGYKDRKNIYKYSFLIQKILLLVYFQYLILNKQTNKQKKYFLNKAQCIIRNFDKRTLFLCVLEEDTRTSFSFSRQKYLSSINSMIT